MVIGVPDDCNRHPVAWRRSAERQCRLLRRIGGTGITSWWLMLCAMNDLLLPEDAAGGLGCGLRMSFLIGFQCHRASGGRRGFGVFKALEVPLGVEIRST